MVLLKSQKNDCLGNLSWPELEHVVLDYARRGLSKTPSSC